MCGLRGGRELKTTRVAKQASTGWRWLQDCMEEIPAKVSSCQRVLAFLSLRGAKRRGNLGEPDGIATPRFVGARNDKNAWCWMKQAATKSWRRDLNLQVSSLVFGTGKGTAASFLPPLDSSRWRGKEADGADEQNDYFYPRRILHREGAGRSWATKNTSNLCGVE